MRYRWEMRGLCTEKQNRLSECVYTCIYGKAGRKNCKALWRAGYITNETSERKDKRRKVNYKYYTDREWGMARNYHITLDSGELGQERCVQI
mgnify:CR=1 FL=1